ncbi:helix-turn-helix domain-containing protein [Bacillus sp. V2I10]|uniref:helix-turn-helix domain-containing protein n=1 Tax=Bacillus sp. V2I10 TaxID=3042276 RepID=UPI00277F45EE|nr:helix-turn-helix domain-containing protein [Bacillus sp. V2I10]MDQ0856700.1 transposase [Bacillus sp. V2I10]
MAKSPFSALEKYEIITAYENRSFSSLEFCQQMNLARSTIKHWIHLFKTYGIDGLQGVKWKGYSKTGSCIGPSFRRIFFKGAYS